MDDRDKVKNEFDQMLFEHEVNKLERYKNEELKKDEFAAHVASKLRGSKFFLRGTWEHEDIAAFKIRQIPLLDKFYAFMEECRLVDAWSMAPDFVHDEYVEIYIETHITFKKECMTYKISQREVKYFNCGIVISRIMEKIAFSIIQLKIEQVMR